MKRPRLKRTRPAVYVSSADFPVGEFLKHCPLSPEHKDLEAEIRGPIGQALLTAITTCHAEGFSAARLEDVARQVVEFYAQEWHRCATCHNWTRDFAAGAVVLDGEFKITVVCSKCGQMVASGRVTGAMNRNMVDFVFGGAK